jgi:Lrp/AsnC family leucine-responsive transcriptional regulator
VKLDATDFRIIRALVQDGRASFAQLGETVGLSPHGAADRVRRLRQGGVIRGFTAQIDSDQLGQSLAAYIDIRLSSAIDPDEFERRARRLAPIESLEFVTGRFDYQARVICADADELDRTVRALRRDAGAAQTETRIVMRSAWRRSVTPTGQRAGSATVARQP